MRTTVDLPDDIFKKAKLQAVHQGVSLKEIITRALERVFAPQNHTAKARQARARRLFKSLDKARNKRPVGRLKREELYDRPLLRGH